MTWSVTDIITSTTGCVVQSAEGPLTAPKTEAVLDIIEARSDFCRAPKIIVRKIKKNIWNVLTVTPDSLGQPMQSIDMQVGSQTRQRDGVKNCKAYRKHR